VVRIPVSYSCPGIKFWYLQPAVLLYFQVGKEGVDGKMTSGMTGKNETYEMGRTSPRSP
jgi:hypothetical protein